MKYLLFSFGVSIIFLHLLRNLSSIYYVIFAMVLIGFLLASVRYSSNRLFSKTLAVSGMLFVYVLMVSGVADPDESLYVGLFRLFYLFPVVLYFFSSDINEKMSSFFWRIVLLFLIFASISIPLQYLLGPISWFAEPSTRAGIERFSSLAGSLTAFGSLVGLGVLVLYFLRPSLLFTIPFVFMLCLGALFSLQKMSLLSIAMAVLLIGLNIYCRNGVGVLINRFSLLLLLPLASLGCVYVFAGEYVGDHINYIFSVVSSDASDVGDVSVFQSVLDRMSELPIEAIQFWGVLELMLGVGVFGGAGGLGYPELPMAHNLFVEIFLIFGVFFGGGGVYFLFKYLHLSFILLSTSRNDRISLSAAVFISVVAVSVFTGGLFFQPVIGMIFWFSFSEIVRLSKDGSLS